MLVLAGDEISPPPALDRKATLTTVNQPWSVGPFLRKGGSPIGSGQRYPSGYECRVRSLVQSSKKISQNLPRLVLLDRFYINSAGLCCVRHDDQQEPIGDKNNIGCLWLFTTKAKKTGKVKNAENSKNSAKKRDSWTDKNHHHPRRASVLPRILGMLAQVQPYIGWESPA